MNLFILLFNSRKQREAFVMCDFLGRKRDEALRKSAWQGSEKYAGMLSVRLYIH